MYSHLRFSRFTAFLMPQWAVFRSWGGFRNVPLRWHGIDHDYEGAISRPDNPVSEQSEE
ncbi:hypothetical protein J3T99_03420 [Acetobacteraceae bacterium B3987]|nr:hypothetical protein [Acetobacteraceae bacterium B3987]